MDDPKPNPPESQPSADGSGEHDASAALAERDRLFVHSKSDTGYRVIRNRKGSLEVGELRALEEGRPISAEVLRLEPTEHEQIFDVETIHDGPAPTRSKSGPAQVATDAYRQQWDSIFGDRSRLN